MIERHEEDGFTAAYVTADWEPADPADAMFVKLVYDDGRVMVLRNPDAPEPAPEPALEPAPEPVADDPEEHEHDSEPWSKHRARFAPKTLRIYGQSLSAWAKAIFLQDAERIHTAISVGLTAGESNTDIAHRVIGSRRQNGANGVTEVTRQHILHLGRGLLQKRKSRMRGSPAK